ncbi:MAG: hypothetical protein ACJ786_30250 [Catenulispora sp.]
MKYKTETRHRTVLHGPAGQERPVRESYTVRVPVMPRDWDSIAIKAAVTVVLLLTLSAVIWSTWSIGALLHGWIGYAAAAVFDMSWLVNVLLEWLARNSRKKRTFSKRMGWALLVATMGAIAWHGLLAGGVAMAVVGAAVSMFAKLLWMGIMKHINRDLSDLDEQWVDAEVGKANATLAVAGARRAAARVEAQATLELLDAEQTRREMAGLMAPETELEPVHVSPETASDAVTPRRRDVISPSGEGADVRPELESAQVKGHPEGLALRPEEWNLLRMLLAEHAAEMAGSEEEDEYEDQQDQEEEPEPERRISIANGVRRLVGEGVTDPKVVTAALPELIGYQPNPESVARELRAAKSKLAKALKASETGLYL